MNENQHVYILVGKAYFPDEDIEFLDIKSAAPRRKSGKECKSKVVPWSADTVIVGSVLQDSESEREGHQLGGSTTEYYQMFERSVGVQATSRVHTRGCQASKTTKEKQLRLRASPSLS